MYRFLLKPRWILSHVLVLGLIVSMILLMMWQFRRLDEKRALNARIAARADGTPAQLVDVLRDDHIVTAADGDRVEFRAVVTEGTYDTAAEFTVPNRTLDGTPGRLVITPLRFAPDQPPILVLRGFIPQAVDQNTAPIKGIEPPAGPVQVRGWLRESELPGGLQKKTVDLGSNRIARLDLDRVGEARNQTFQPVYLELGAQAPPTTGEAIRPYPLPQRDEGPHFAYAMQWGVFTLIAIGGYPLVIRRVARGGGKDRKDDVPTDDPDDLPVGTKV